MADRGQNHSKFLGSGKVAATDVNLTQDLVPVFKASGKPVHTNPHSLKGGITPTAPVNTSAPFVTPAGPVAVGTLLTGNRGTWTGSPTFTDSWTKDGVTIDGATFTTYTPVSGDATHLIRYVPAA